MKCLRPFTKEVSGHDILKDGIPATYVSFPCGKCLACRINKTRQWSLRLYHESLYAGSCAFITLTYDEDHLPRDENDNPAVCYEDIRHFLARLRKKYKFRYFINSEYGPDTTRPHYHGLLFFEDPFAWESLCEGAIKIVRKGKKGAPIVSYRSFVLESFWKGGNCEIGEVVPARCTYTAKYFIDRKEVDNILVPNFSVMSRRPGIGLDFAEEAKESIRTHYAHSIITPIGSRVSTPRYYRSKVFSEGEIKAQFEEFAKKSQDSPLLTNAEIFQLEHPEYIEQIRLRNRGFTNSKSKQL